MIPSQIIQYLEKEKKKYQRIAQEAGKRVREAPDGTVRVIRHRNSFQFFIRTDPKDKNGTYLPKAEYARGAALVQKKYDQKILAASEKQAAVIDRFLKYYEPGCLKRIYTSLSDTRKSCLSPFEISDEEYAGIWQKEEYIHKPFLEGTPVHYTSRGERVRSKSEVMIADALDRAGIPYKYERPLQLEISVIHPDFTILRPEDRSEIYWEHLGMMDDPAYCLSAIQRIRLYEAGGLFPGISLILTMELSNVPINLAVINQMIRIYCQ